MHNRLYHGIPIGYRLNLDQCPHNRIIFLNQIHICLFFVAVGGPHHQMHFLVPIAVDVRELGLDQHLGERVDVVQGYLGLLEAFLQSYFWGNLKQHEEYCYYSSYKHL